mmetsp:Transcript_22522/g.36816  ORF Transcript_22522/g.36816 Transcript_22522/m.36816 type:complete len:230 (+) Transcript_22522:116-805(+)
MRKAVLLLLTSITAKQHNASASAFVALSPAATRPGSHSISALPTTAQVSTDDFMKQLGHASQIIPVLHPEDGSSPSGEQSAALLEVLQKQFAHSDGIRGFFAVYLTSPESLTMEEVPSVLVEAVRGADTKVMVPLACMNVIMPTAMTSIHQDPELKECASKTADNGLKILRLLKGESEVVSNCKAIYQVASDKVEGGDDLIEYWNKFFINYKYGPEQKADISRVIQEFC